MAASVQTPTVFRAKKHRFSAPFNTKFTTNGVQLYMGYNYNRGNLKKHVSIRCSFSSSSNSNGRINDPDYVNSTIVEAVEVRSDAEGFMIKLRDTRQHLRCVHNNTQLSHTPDAAPHHAIVLKMEDGTGLLLPIIVLEMQSVLLMAAIRDIPIARPTMYHVFKDMIEKMGYTVRLARVTRKVDEAYVAELHLAKADNEADFFSFELRPSDAINIAVRCKAQIQVNKLLAYSDGMRVTESSKVAVQIPSLDGQLFAQMDRPSGQPCIEAKEFDLVGNMLVAAIEERYRDAALWRDKLTQFRSNGNWA